MDIDVLRFLPAPLLIGIWAAILVIGVIINVLFAAGVGNDANELRREGGRTQIAGQAVWVLATLLGGVFVAAVYWLIHRSALSRVELRHGEAPPD
jgi:phosphate/sulfate permease